MVQPLFQSYVFLIFAILLLMAAAAWSAPRKKGQKPWGLVGLRWLILLCVACILARPSCSRQETETYPGSVLILADTSRSMDVVDAVPTAEGSAAHPTEREETAPSTLSTHSTTLSISRFAAMRESLDASAEDLSSMASEVETEIYAFDQTLRSLALRPNGQVVLPRDASGDETALGSSLLALLQKTSGKKVLGVVLLSDGAQRALPPRDALPQTAAQRLNRLGIPLFTVCFGTARQQSQAKDAAVEDILVDQRVFVDTEVAVSGRIRLDGLEGRDVPVELLVEKADGAMEVAAQTTVRAEAPSETLPVQLSWTPKEPGEVKVTLRVPPLSEETSAANNQLDAFVTVVKSGLRVLYLESAFRPENSFLRRSLDSAGEIQLDLIRLERNGVRGEALKKDSSVPELKSLLKNGEYAVFILGDVPAACLTQEEWTLLAEKVESGTGLLTLGGVQAYAPESSLSTTLVQLLPIRPGSSAGSSAGGSAGNSAGNSAGSEDQWNAEVRMRLTPAGRHHLALALDSDAAYSAQLWEKLPPLDGANFFRELKPGTVILASDFTEENQEIPLLLERSYGRGRVMTLAVDSTWRWWLGGFEETHKRFWRQLVFWLANRETTLEGTVSLIIPQRRFPQEQKITFQVSARLSNGETPPIPARNSASENWSAILESPDGIQTIVPLSPENGLMVGEIPPNLSAGDYMLHAAVTHLGQKIGETRCRFQVYHHDLELDRAQSEPELMAALALSTGGEAVSPGDLAELWKKLAQARQELKIERTIETPLWDRWWWLTAILALLSAEWYLRKRTGFV